MSPLIDFYRGIGTDHRGRTLAALWAFSDERMEAIHDFIQWMFPLREPSQFNPDAPLLSLADIAEFRRDSQLSANLILSLDRFLGFVGLVRGEGQVAPGPAFAARRDVWLFPNHNWLRVTRVLHCLRILGLEQEAQALFACLKGLNEKGEARITPETLRYWEAAVIREPS